MSIHSKNFFEKVVKAIEHLNRNWEHVNKKKNLFLEKAQV